MPRLAVAARAVASLFSVGEWRTELLLECVSKPEGPCGLTCSGIFDTLDASTCTASELSVDTTDRADGCTCGGRGCGPSPGTCAGNISRKGSDPEDGTWPEFSDGYWRLIAERAISGGVSLGHRSDGKMVI